jgi:7,8-dihydroneopterin aldolase/epimerase/oxygenase
LTASFRALSDLPAPAGATGPLAQPLDLIFIEGFVGHTVIGIHDCELHAPQAIRIDLHAGVERSPACDSDHIGDTIDYSLVHARLRRLLVEHRLQLLEAFAETIADILLGEFGARWVRVKVTKPRKFDNVESVGVQIEREASQATRPAESRSATTARHAAVLHLIGSGMVPGKR